MGLVNSINNGDNEKNILIVCTSAEEMEKAYKNIYEYEMKRLRKIGLTNEEIDKLIVGRTTSIIKSLNIHYRFREVDIEHMPRCFGYPSQIYCSPKIKEKMRRRVCPLNALPNEEFIKDIEEIMNLNRTVKNIGNK